MKMPTEPQHHDSEVEYELRPEDVLSRLDPELQNAVLSRREGLRLPRYLCERLAGGGEVVDVIAKLRRPGAEVEGLNIYQRIGRIVTGTVAVEDIVRVRKHRDVHGLKGARRVRPMLAHSVPEIRATADQLRAALLEASVRGVGELDGSGVVVGIVDHGCDFAHPNFRKLVDGAPGPTRILYLWDQRGGADKTSPEGFGRSPRGYGYGREFRAEALNRALRKAPPRAGDPGAPHRYLGYEINDPHGTQVMDVAVGNGGGRNPPGVAPGADIIFVDSSLGQSPAPDAPLGNSRHLLEAVKYVFDKARELKKRAVINISLNYYGGPHDGTTPVEEAFDLLLERPGRAIVIAAGNSRNLETHVRRVMHPHRTCTLFWEVQEGNDTDDKLEVWYGGRHRLEVSLKPPGCHGPLGPVRPGSTCTVLRRGGKVGRVFNRLHDSSNGDNHIVVVLDASAQEGVWEVQLRPLGVRSSAPFAIHAWIESDDSISRFHDARLEDRAFTLGTLACGHSTIAVSGYDPLDDDRGVPVNHAEGPTRDGKHKPEVSAPGAGIIAARPLSDTVTGPPESGTSLAAPHVAGVVALLMQAAREPPTIEQTRDLVIGTARRNPPAQRNVWDSRYGVGRVDARAAVLACLRSQQPVVLVEETHELIVAGAVVSPPPGGEPGATPEPAAGVAVTLAVETHTVTVALAAQPEASGDTAAPAGDNPEAAAPDVADARPEPPETEGH